MEPNPTFDSFQRPTIWSVAAYGRAYSQGLRPYTHNTPYRRALNGTVEYWEDNKWKVSQDVKAGEALTNVGWPPDLEVEPIAGLYAPTPLKGCWTRFYWRAVETAACWLGS